MEPKVSVETVPFPAKQGKYREYLRHAPETGRRMPSNPLIILPFQFEFPIQRNRENLPMEQGNLTSEQGINCPGRTAAASHIQGRFRAPLLQTPGWRIGDILVPAYHFD